jgi:thiamine-monophosphate kinase
MADESKAESAEQELIARYFKPLATHPGAFGLVDDAAAIAPPAGCDLVLKTDGVIAGVHFFPEDPPDTVAKKVLRMNLSDLAAKGAKPLGFLLALALPQGTGEAWLKPFARGLGEDAELFGCPLFGGDTDHTPGPISVSVAAFGTVPHGKMVRRAGASPGDRVVVTGTIGDSALGLKLRLEPATARRWGIGREQQEHLKARYLVPQPRNAMAEALRAHASAAMDVSDGLAGDLAKLCRASGVAALIECARVPLSDAARAASARESALIETIVSGGDDYEILATVAPAQVEPLRRAAAAAGIVLTEIGDVTAGEGEAQFIGADGKPLALARPAFSHF